MAKKIVYLCPSCHSFFSSDAEEVKPCPNCNVALNQTEIDYSVFSKMEPSEKQAFKRKYLMEIGVDDAATLKNSSFVPAPNTKWVGFLTFCGILAFIGYLIDGIMKIMMVVTLGDGIKSLVTGLLILAVTGVVKQVVLDIHKIRNDVARHTNR